MCGIAGALLREPTDGGVRRWVAAAGAMESVLAHRGPDDSGVHVSADRRCVLASRRLAIQDLSADGRMPLGNEDGTVWTAFNGEIYNFKALRETLRAHGHLFRSGSDTEVIVHGYEQWGVGVLGRLDGMFAVAVYDERDGTLLLARDRFGEKPLYYARTPAGDLTFASEIKALFAAVDLPRRVAPEALCQYLTYGFAMPPLTLFDGVGKLGPGECLRLERGGRPERFRFWTPGSDASEAARVAALGEAERVADVRRLLQDSVAARMVADVPVGAFLSGGVDSSAVVALMSRLSGRPVETVTVANADHPEIDEWAYAERVSREVGARAHRVDVSEREALEALPTIAWHLDEPLGDPAAINSYFASRALRAGGVVVALVGEGADEVFLGYQNYLRYRSMARAMRLVGRLPGPLLRAGGALGGAALGMVGAGVHRDLLRRAARGGTLFLGTETFFNDGEKPDLIGGDLAARYPADAVAVAVQGQAPPHMRGDDLAVFAFAELRMRMAEKLLMRVDKMSSAHSIEVRSPFLDHRLVDYALAVPSRDRTACWATTKHLLKEAVAPFIPHEVIHRRKQGFSTPVPAWLRGETGRRLEATIADARLFRDGVLRRAPVLAVLAAHRAGGAAARATHTRLWNVLVLAEWYDRFGLDGVAEAPARGDLAA